MFRSNSFVDQMKEAIHGVLGHLFALHRMKANYILRQDILFLAELCVKNLASVSHQLFESYNKKRIVF